MIYIGIDTGVSTGIAIWNKQKRSFEMVETLAIHKAMIVVQGFVSLQKSGVGDKVVVRVEDPRQRTWFGTERMSRDEERKRLQGVGSVKRDAKIWEDFLSDLDADFEMVAPKQNVTKLNSDVFKTYTKWPKRTSEHSRDAAMLVFGL